MESNKDEMYLMTTVDIALKTIDSISQHPEGLRTVDIANEIEIGRSSAFKMLYTLEKIII